ncbi:BZ3500_MvSof-1268-A1-R1_Chr2-1g04519 [Microbotryum saponariae]|uniref:BZ3500_MvSof-1268-A1-R1_Chr2-1g04519 protein n=1 Tax=Microbotryum saponariae TaxID=289078 RepID=A0A2X0MJL1_9BASI|nr:BZ3500_MvSof-1268-A1-R1_Chr2-1g04519 [Microbotryum saponariae]SCZ91905.1 BZ3501_MvSof-1269-A2-R1_Chr2-1g04175 [Microbotryum saponariae]
MATAQDILPSLPTAVPLLIVDSILNALTHPNPTRRRVGLALVLLYCVLALRLLAIARHMSLASAPASLSRPATARSTSSRDPDDGDEVPVYDDSPPVSSIQRDNLARLVHLIDTRKSAYPPRRLTEMALQHPSNRLVAVTAVVLHWKRRRGLQLVLKQLSKYPFIREIIVWNNHPGVSLKASDFFISPQPSSDLPQPRLRIFNSPSNVHDAGKHFACSMATTEHCYFNDDDWLNIYLDSLYTKYIDTRSGIISGSASASTSSVAVPRIVSNTMPVIHLEHHINLHTGFTWIGCGSFAPKALSVQFLNQQSAAPVMLTRDQTLVSDMFFSLWTNTYPEQMPNDLVPIDVEGGDVGWSTGVDQWAIVYENVLDAVRKLHDILTVQDTYLVPDPFPTNPSPPESQLRAPCANDECLFMTSLTPFPHPLTLIYPLPTKPSFWANLFFRKPRHREVKSRHRLPSSTSSDVDPKFDPYAIDHMHEHEARFNAMPNWPTDEWWTRNGSWHLAVDGKPHDQTCWSTLKAPDADDYFGLSFIRPRAVTHFTIVGSTTLLNLVSWETPDQTAESWQVFTTREHAVPHEVGGWEPRRFVGSIKIRQLRVGIIEIKGELERQHPRDEELEQKDVDLMEEGEADELLPVVKIAKIKFVSHGRKVEPLSVCGFDLDGFKV